MHAPYRHPRKRATHTSTRTRILVHKRKHTLNTHTHTNTHIYILMSYFLAFQIFTTDQSTPPSHQFILHPICGTLKVNTLCTRPLFRDRRTPLKIILFTLFRDVTLIRKYIVKYSKQAHMYTHSHPYKHNHTQELIESQGHIDNHDSHTHKTKSTRLRSYRTHIQSTNTPIKSLTYRHTQHPFTHNALIFFL